ncbi:MAG: endonuclease V [Candidatus Zixiibacteriota bacterium]
MSYPTLSNSHPWSVSWEEAEKIQRNLSTKVILKDDFEKLRKISGVGIVFSKRGDEVLVACVIFSFPEMWKILHTCFGRGEVRFPYTPGFFAFSAGPAIISTLEKMPKPDLVIFPGRGIAHPRKLGLASHLGVLLDLPTIACSKKQLWRDSRKLSGKKGSHIFIRDDLGMLMGAVVRTREGVKPIYVTPGNKISTQTAVKLVLECSPRFRIPEPLRQAHILAERLILHKENNF